MDHLTHGTYPGLIIAHVGQCDSANIGRANGAKDRNFLIEWIGARGAQELVDVDAVGRPSPQLMVIEGETATIQVGDQVPIVTKSVQIRRLVTTSSPTGFCLSVGSDRAG